MVQSSDSPANMSTVRKQCRPQLNHQHVKSYCFLLPTLFFFLYVLFWLKLNISIILGRIKMYVILNCTQKRHQVLRFEELFRITASSRVNSKNQMSRHILPINGYLMYTESNCQIRICLFMKLINWFTKQLITFHASVFKVLSNI